MAVGDHHPHDHSHHRHEPHEHDYGHHHPSGIKGAFHGLFVPHSHDASDSIDDELEASSQGIRAVKISLVVLLITAVLQVSVVAISGSVALLADTIHNFSDALTAIPLWIAFTLSRRPPTRRFTFGLGRSEDLAGLFIVAMIAASAVLAGVESVHRLIEPRTIEHTGWVFAAGIIGFLGNEIVAVYRIRVGRKIGSAALVADGVHARTDGLTSLAVIVGVIGIWLGLPWADPAVGIVISLAIFVLLVSTAKDIGQRLLDGVDPSLTARAAEAIHEFPQIVGITDLQVRWIGHRLHVHAVIDADTSYPESEATPSPDPDPDPGGLSLAEFTELQRTVEDRLRQALPSVGEVVVAPGITASA